MGSLAKVVLGNPTPFALGYTFGNILSLLGTTFLVGPANQLRAMTDKKRLAASMLYLASLFVTLLSAIILKSRLLCLVSVICQFCALVWYTLSCIHGGQEFVTRLITSV
eukprot:GHVO01038915.1.p1 GENE.GHVO01038915.1~~GHVO01038915.1.p1  ORF type:complete len:109 (+),score=1.88 GHVO01038915.1:203-529(+)